MQQVAEKVEDVSTDLSKVWVSVLSSLKDINDAVEKQAGSARDLAISFQDRVSLSLVEAQDTIQSLTTTAAKEVKRA